MDRNRIEALRTELGQLLRKTNRSVGITNLRRSDTEILEYEIRFR